MGAHNVIGAQITLGILESVIRVLAKKRKGRAPLLKDMIEMLLDYENGAVATSGLPAELSVEEMEMLVSVLRGLLLPKGMNLRNLLWRK